MCSRTFDDLRLRMTLTFIPSISIPALAFVFPAKYSHSRYWFSAAGQTLENFYICCHLFLSSMKDISIGERETCFVTIPMAYRTVRSL